MKKLLIFAFLLSASGVLIAESMSDLKNCIDIKDVKKRLTCYDVTAPIAIAVDKALKENREAQNKIKEDDAANKEKERNQQVAITALSALKKMRGQVESGLSYRTYSQALADVKFGAGNYLDSPIAKKNPELTKDISDALSHYENAGLFWNAVFAEGPLASKNKSFIKSYNLPNGMTSRYPGFSQHDTEYGIFVNGGLSVIWTSAAESTDRVSKLVTQ